MTPAPALTEATMDKMTVEQIDGLETFLTQAVKDWASTDESGTMYADNVAALCKLAKIALTPPQDVAALVSELRGLVERATSEQDWFDLEQLECQGFAHKDAALIAKLEPTNMTKLLDCVTSLSARIRELEGENENLRKGGNMAERASLLMRSASGA